MTADIHFSMIPKEDHTKNVLIMFEPGGTGTEKQSASKKKPNRR